MNEPIEPTWKDIDEATTVCRGILERYEPGSWAYDFWFGVLAEIIGTGMPAFHAEVALDKEYGDMDRASRPTVSG